MTVKSTTPLYRTRKGREFRTDLSPDELLEHWRGKYELVFAAEAKARRYWGALGRKSPDAIEAEIAARQVEWDAYAAERLADIATAKSV